VAKTIKKVSDLLTCITVLQDATPFDDHNDDDDDDDDGDTFILIIVALRV